MTVLRSKMFNSQNRFYLRYFQYCAPSESISGEDGRMPLLDAQFEETKETLATRAEYSARAFIALNLQFDRILGTLPTDEGDEAFQYLTLEKLTEENEKAGFAVDCLPYS
jgi:hypothetical protein